MVAVFWPADPCPDPGSEYRAFRGRLAELSGPDSGADSQVVSVAIPGGWPTLRHLDVLFPP